MRILITGANGYIGSHLLPVLVEAGHHTIALTRSVRRSKFPEHLEKEVEVVIADLLDQKSLDAIPKDINAAYYLVHSMGQRATGFSQDEATCAKNFRNKIAQTSCQQIIYLSGLSSGNLSSEHMASRRNVEEILNEGSVPVTTLRAGIIIGAGSASFEMIRDLVEKLPVMVAPRWVASQCQPIAITDVIFYLKKVLGKTRCYDQTFEIGGPEVLTYREMLLQFAKARGLRRWILPVPVLTPRLSSYWLFFITSTSFPLAQALVESLKTDAVCVSHSIHSLFPHPCANYKEALQQAFVRIEQNTIVSSWKDAIVQSALNPKLKEYIEVPTHGCLKEVVEKPYRQREKALQTLWSIGGDRGWYFMHWAWKLRGLLDRICGGSGLRRGRTHPTRLQEGDVLDFWRVLLADRKNGHLLLYAEMRVPGEAWLEYRIEGSTDKGKVIQTATFRPKGLMGRLYWYALAPIHFFIFRRLCQAIASGAGAHKQKEEKR